MLRYLFLFMIFSACQSTSTSNVDLSKDFEDALKNNDTALAKKIAQRELDKTRSSITDSSFAALIDANLELQNIEFKIQKNDSTAIDKENLKKLHSFIIRVYNFALIRSIQKSDKDYYTGKSNMNSELWIADYFMDKTKKQLQISLLLLQKEIAVASAITNGVDTKEIRRQTEDSYNKSIKIINEAP